jgi:hypothetical protein
VDRSGPQRDAAEPLQVVADPVAAELEVVLVLVLRRAVADPKALRRALRRIEELLDESQVVAAAWRAIGRGGGGLGARGLTRDVAQEL